MNNKKKIKNYNFANLIVSNIGSLISKNLFNNRHNNNSANLSNRIFEDISNIKPKSQKPKPRSEPLKTIFSPISEEEYRSGIISKKTQNIIINNLNKLRSKLKKQLKSNTINKDKIKSSIKRTKVRVYRKINKTLKSVKYVLNRRSLTPLKNIIKVYNKRSKCTPIKLTKDKIDLLLYDSTRTGDNKTNIIANKAFLIDPCKAILYINNNNNNVSACALLSMVRLFQRNAGLKNNMIDVAVLDIYGSVRQQKRILKYIYDKFNKINLYVTKPIRDKINLYKLFELIPDHRKLIDYKIPNLGEELLKPEFPGTKSLSFKSYSYLVFNGYLIKR